MITTHHLYLCLGKFYLGSDVSHSNSFVINTWWLCMLKHQSSNLLKADSNSTPSKTSFKQHQISWKLDCSHDFESFTSTLLKIKKVLNENDTYWLIQFLLVYTLEIQNLSLFTNSVNIHFQVMSLRSHSSQKCQT